jgi:uncharacterized protein with PQ loop repeat
MPRKHHHHHVTIPRKTAFDYVVYVFSIITPLFELPQAYTIYANHSSRNISPYTWSFFILDNLVWIAYGIKQRSKPLIITSCLYLVIEACIVYGIFLYHT